MPALIWSTFAFSGNLNLLKNFPLLLLSMRCHLSFFLLLHPLSLAPECLSALNMWVSGVSFQSILALLKSELFSFADVCTLATVEVKKPSKGSQMSRENGSNTLVPAAAKEAGDEGWCHFCKKPRKEKWNLQWDELMKNNMQRKSFSDRKWKFR